MSSLRLRLCSVGALIWAAAPAPASAAPTEVAVSQKDIALSAHAGTLAWSAYDPAISAFRIMVREPGQAPRVLPVRPQAAGFDLDLGTNLTGSLYLVYSRCRTPSDGIRPPSDCDLYRTALASGREEHLAALSSRWDEREPTISAGQIAFVRRERGAGAAMLDTVRVGATAGPASPTRVHARSPVRRAALQDPELGGGRLAYTVAGRGPHGFGQRQLRLRTLRSALEAIVYTARSGGANFANITGASFDADGSHLYWARTNQGSGTGNRLIRYTVSSRRLAYAQGRTDLLQTGWLGGAEQLAFSTSAFGAEGFCHESARDPQERSDCRLLTSGPVRWHAEP